MPPLPASLHRCTDQAASYQDALPAGCRFVRKVVLSFVERLFFNTAVAGFKLLHFMIFITGLAFAGEARQPSSRLGRLALAAVPAGCHCLSSPAPLMHRCWHFRGLC